MAGRQVGRLVGASREVGRLARRLAGRETGEETGQRTGQGTRRETYQSAALQCVGDGRVLAENAISAIKIWAEAVSAASHRLRGAGARLRKAVC